MDKKHDGVCHCAFCVNLVSVKKGYKECLRNSSPFKNGGRDVLESHFEGRGHTPKGQNQDISLRMVPMAFFSRRETCACEIPTSFEISVCVFPSK